MTGTRSWKRGPRSLQRVAPSCTAPTGPVHDEPGQDTEDLRPDLRTKHAERVSLAMERLHKRSGSEVFTRRVLRLARIRLARIRFDHRPGPAGQNSPARSFEGTAIGYITTIANDSQQSQGCGAPSGFRAVALS